MNPLINADLAALHIEDLAPCAPGRRSRSAREATLFRDAPRRGGSV